MGIRDPWFVGLWLCFAIVGCIPNASRTNAKIESGGGANFVIAGELFPEGRDEVGDTTGVEIRAQPELDLQWGFKNEDHSGFAVQLKIPITVIFASLDLYYEFPSDHPWFFGLGVELGSLYGAYGVVTRYLNNNTYVSFTPRVLTNTLVESERNSEGQFFMINPQLTLGTERFEWADIGLFVSYAYQTGEGINVNLCVIFDSCEEKDFRKNYLLVGLSMRL